jgi:hypothetical protein
VIDSLTHNPTKKLHSAKSMSEGSLSSSSSSAGMMYVTDRSQEEEEEEETWWVEEREREREREKRERVCVVGGKGQAKHNENTPQKGQVNQPKSPFFLCFFP